MAARAWRPQSRRWRIAPAFAGAEELARKLHTAPLVAQVLHNRGIRDVEAALAFMNPKLTDLHDPQLLPNIDAAAGRIAQALRDRQRIVIYGDYDVDGITGAAILHRCLTMLGGSADVYVPHRLEEGYGVNLEAVRKIIAEGTKLMITVDCGISADAPVAAASDAGMDVIITDHHTPPPKLPAALAIVHPAIEGSGYPNPDLSGSGVAFKLAWQVARAVCGETRVDEPMRNFLLESTCLAALGTIADVVPLLGENRSLAVFGLRGLPAVKHVGLRALLEASGLADEKLDAYHVGFILAPRLNACGRMGHARLAVELLTSATPQRAREIAEYLNQQNAQRQQVERQITEQAIEMAVARGMDGEAHRAIVLASEDWHGGVIGIVAARLVERFSRPAVLVSLNDQGGQGSARSIRGFHMRDALAACSDCLTSFGGHAMAGGLRIDPDRIEAFTSAFLDYARDHIQPEELLPTLEIDAQTTLGALNYNVVSHLERLAPFGQGNGEPVVAVRACEVLVGPRRMGRNGQTVSLMLRQDGVAVRAVGFNMGDLADHLVGINMVDVAGQPKLNRFNGNTSVELELRDVAWG